jgi:hypothetical protein
LHLRVLANKKILDAGLSDEVGGRDIGVSG